MCKMIAQPSSSFQLGTEKFCTFLHASFLCYPCLPLREKLCLWLGRSQVSHWDLFYERTRRLRLTRYHPFMVSSLSSPWQDLKPNDRPAIHHFYVVFTLVNRLCPFEPLHLCLSVCPSAFLSAWRCRWEEQMSHFDLEPNLPTTEFS